MNIQDRIIKEIKGISFTVITEGGKERTFSHDFNNVDKSEITTEYNDTTDRFRLNVNIEGYQDRTECNTNSSSGTFTLNNPCLKCPNYISNGGSGICECTLGIQKIN